MKTSIITYKRGNKKVILIGCSHVGTKEYYKKIQKICDKGQKVLYEQVKGDSLKEKDNLFNTQEFLGDLFKEILTSQNKGINYKKEWINADINKNQLINLTGERFNLKKNSLKIKKIKKFCLAKKGLVLFLLKNIDLFQFLITSKRMSKELILNLRNSICILKFSEILKENKKIVILYGEAHLKGLGKMLKEMGFKKTNKYKLVAI